MKDKLEIIYIMGEGRSGSTIASVILGSHPEIISVGELNRWPEYKGLTKPVDDDNRDEEFWSEIREVYQDREIPDFGELMRIQGSIENYKNFPNLLIGRTSKEVLGKYSSYIHKLFEVISSVSDKNIIVDESKCPGRGWVFTNHQNLNSKIIHLVRDPRGVAFSQLKKDVEHKSKPVIVSSIHYLIKNLMCIIVDISSDSEKLLRLRYEDLVQSPEMELDRIGNFIGLNMAPVIDKINKEEPFIVPHLLDGNRIRKKNSVFIRFDDEWKKSLSVVNKILVSVITFPLLLLFRYPIFQSND